MVDESICGGQKSPGGSERAWRPIRTARMVAGVVGLTVVLLATLVTGVAAAPAPAAPPGLTAVLRSTGDGRNPQVVLRWDAPGSAVPVVGYNVDRNGSYYRTVPGTEFVDDVAAGETYVYEVSAFSGAPSDRGFGPKSDEVSVTVPAAADPSVPIEDPTVGGPSGKGPLLPTNLTAVAVTGDTEAVNPDGIRVSWTPGGGPESIGFNVSRNGQYLTSIMGRSWFVDCDVFAGQTYSYKVSAWSEGPEFSFSSGSAQATASVTPQECVPLTPPGPGGPDGPFEDPIFDVARDVDARPPTPQNVRIAGERLQWDMPQGPRFLFQITRNSLTDRIGEMWGQFSVTSGHPDLEYAQLSDGRVRFSIPIDQFGAGDRFHISAVHPYEIPDIVPRFSERSRFATITKDGPGEIIGNFLTTFGTDELPSGSWIGSRDDWNPVAQFSDEFNDGSGLLVDRENPGWFFARSDGPTEISPSPLRDQTQTDRRAVRKDGKLEMSAGLDDGSYSYIGTADNNGNGYFVDPTNGVFVEASVRLDRMTPADNAWWAFWLMTPGTDACTADGGPAPNGFNAYDGHARTGMEIDIFEFVPDLDNGFNQALFTYDPDNRPEGCDTLDKGKLSPFGKNFTYEGGDLPGVDMPNYMDGDYHRLGMYYAQDCYAFYIDDELIWKVTEAEHPGWITDRARESIRLTWEIQNPRITSGGDQINNPWTSQGGDFANSAIDQDPTVSIDFVNVWEKKESANGLCSGGPDPEPTTDPEPDPESNPGPETQPALAAPVDVAAVSTNEGIQITWQPGAGVEADGYDISRNGEGYWSVSDELEFTDTQVTDGQSYTYEVTPWIKDDNDTIRYGQRSQAVSHLIALQPGPTPDLGLDVEPDPDRVPDETVRTPQQLNGAATSLDIGLWWDLSTGENMVDPAGYVIERDGYFFKSVSGERATFFDTDVLPGVTYTYQVYSYAGPPERRVFSPKSAPFTVIMQGATPDAIGGRTPPGEVTEISVSQPRFEKSVRVSWEAAPNTYGYYVYRQYGFYTGLNHTSTKKVKVIIGTSQQMVFDDPYVPAGLPITYSVRPFNGEGDNRVLGALSPRRTIVVSAGAEVIKPTEVVDPRAAYRGSTDPTKPVNVHLYWRAPAGWDQGSIGGYLIERDGEMIATLTDAYRQMPDLTRTDSRSFCDCDGVDRGKRYRYTITPFSGAKSNPIMGPSVEQYIAIPDEGTGKETGVDRTDTDPPTDKRFLRAMEVLFPDAGSTWQQAQARSFYRLYLRVFEGEQFVVAEVRSLNQALLAKGYVTGIDQGVLESAPALDSVQYAKRLIENVARSAGSSDINANIPRYEVQGHDYFAEMRRSLATKLTESPEVRTAEFLLRQSEMEESLAILETRPKNKTHLKHAEYRSLAAAQILLGIESARHENLWTVNRLINEGIRSENKVFFRKFNAATKAERIEFFGFSEVQWEMAEPYIDLSREVKRARNALGNTFRRLVKLVIAFGFAYVTGGLAGAAITGIFGTGSVAAVAAMAVSAGVGSYTFTFMLTGSTAQAENAALRSMLQAGFDHFAKLEDLNRYQKVMYAVFSAGLESLDGGDFADKFLENLIVQLVPADLSEKLEDLDNLSPFMAGAIEELLFAVIRHGDDWDKIGADLENYVAEYAGSYVAAFVGANLPQEWGEFGNIIAELAGKAIEFGDFEDFTELRAYFEQEIVPRLAADFGGLVTEYFSDTSEFLGLILGEFAELGAASLLLEPRDRAAFIEQEMQAYIFDLAGDRISGGFSGMLVEANGGENHPLIDSFSGLLDVVITNAWKNQAEFESAIRAYALGELRQAVMSLFPSCGFEWGRNVAEGALNAVVVTYGTSGGTTERAQGALADFLTETVASESFGTDQGLGGACDAAVDTGAGDDPEDDADSCDVVLAGAPAAAVAVPNGALGAGFGPSRRSSSLVASGLVSRSVAPDQCGSAQQFARWLIGLQSFQMDRIVSSSSTGSTVVRAVDEALGFDAFSLMILDGESFGLVYRDNGGLVGQPLSIYVGVERDGRGDVVNFTEFDVPDGFDVFFDGLSGDALRVVSSFIDGCASSVGENLEAMKAAVLELWNSENIVAYLVDKWEEIEEILDAFDSDPAAFVEQFLRDLVRDEEFGQDRARWAGLITCDVALAVLLAAVPGATAGPLARLLDRLPEIRRFESDPDRDADSVIGPTCSTNSFPTGTLVLMADGSRRPIDGIDPGDWVLAADETSGVWSSREVLDQWSYQDQGQMATVTLADGSQVTATDHHEFWVASDGAWLELEDVQAGDWLLTPDGLTEVVRVDVSAVKSTLVWELDVAIDDTFAVFTGTTDVLVHNASTCFDAHAEPQGYEGRSFEELMPNGFVPASGAFNQWWDDLSVSEFDYLVLNGQIRERMIARIRGDEPNHEWCMCSLMGYFKKNWDISMAEIRAFVTPTGDVHGTVPDNRYLGVAPGTPWAHPTSGFENSRPSKDFHEELEQLIFESDTKSDFARDLPALLADWGVPANVVPIPDW